MNKLLAKDLEKHYNEKAFFAKLKRFALKLGNGTLGLALTMFYTLKDKNTPKWAKTIIITALAYLILPLDAIPDFIPGLGFTDDLSALVTAFSTISSHIKDEHKEKAQFRLNSIFQK